MAAWHVCREAPACNLGVASAGTVQKRWAGKKKLAEELLWFQLGLMLHSAQQRSGI